MQIAAAASSNRDSLAAAKSLTDSVREALAGRDVDLAFFFISRHHAPRMEEAFSLVSDAVQAKHLIGCSGESVLGGADEFDQGPGMSLWAASLPGVQLCSTWIQKEETPDGSLFTGIPEIPRGPATLVLLGEPFSFPADEFIRHMAADHAELRIVGGMASAARAPGENRLFRGDEVLVDGAVAVLFEDGVDVRSIVSQGCRPFGKPLVVTRCQENVIYELGGESALEKFTEQAGTLDPKDMEVLSRGVHIGRAVDSSRASDGKGNYLVRNVMGFDKDSGALALTDEIRPGQTVQFHLRDPQAASDELKALLEDAAAHGPAPAGGLLFTCNGRGRRLFEVPSHDASSIAARYGGLPLAGFFAAGEIGPVGSQNFLHGFTAVVTLLCPEAGK